MKFRWLFPGMVLAFGTTLAMNQASPQEKEESSQEQKEKKVRKATKGKKAKKKEAAEELDPAMEALMKAGTPGKEHKVLEPLAGDWNTAVKGWRAPDAPVQESKGTCKRTWIMGGRFLKEEVGGDFMGQSFQGLGLLGYDNLKKKYITVWADSMSTAIMTSLGSSDEGRKVFTFSGEYDDPMTGKVKKMKTVLRIEGDDRHHLEMFDTGPDGKEFRSLDIAFTRK